jgi:hypothetical protein
MDHIKETINLVLKSRLNRLFSLRDAEVLSQKESRRTLIYKKIIPAFSTMESGLKKSGG